MRRRHLRPAAFAAALIAAGALAACGGEAEPDAQGFGVNRDLQLADCDDWNESGVDDRLTTVEQIREFAGGPVGNVAARGAILDDEEAYDLMERYCANEFAGGPVGNVPARGAILDDDEAYDLMERYCASEFAGAFKLYKLYTRSAAFTGH